MVNNNSKWMVAACALALGSVAQAQSAGSWLVRGGVTQLSPKVTSDNLTAPSLAGTKVDVQSATQLTGGITYMVTDNFAVDVPLALPFKHDIVGDGAISGVGKIGETKALPITVFAQYRFMPTEASVRPYVGLGLTYAKFFKEKGTVTLSALTGGSPTTLSIESKMAPTLQAGAVFNINKKWFADVMISKTFLKTKTKLSTGQTIDTKLDPLGISLAIGYRF